MSETTWTKEQEDELRLLLTARKSGSQIASAVNAKFGTAYTRNAVIGKINRLGLSAPRKIKAAGTAPRKRYMPVERVVTIRRPVPVAERPVALVIGDIAPGTITLLELEDGMCKWLTGDLYCGTPTGDKRTSYCSGHRKAGTIVPRPYVRRY